MSRPLRVDLDPADLGRGLAEIVLALLELLREVLERQAIRRLDADELTPAEIESVGAALRDAREQLHAIRQAVAEVAAQPRGKDEQ
jgi:hypothetical protein